MLGTLDSPQIEQLLLDQVIGRIGCHAGGRTYVVPVTYVYDGASIIGHTSAGMKIAMMRENPDVCFEVDAMQDLANWRSVIARGRFVELHGEEATRAMKLLIERLTPLMTSRTSTPSHGVRHADDVRHHEAVIYRIDLSEKTGRFEAR